MIADRDDGMRRSFRRPSDARGLALVEALLVFVIIAILAGVVVFVVNDVTTVPASVHACGNEARRFEDALSSYQGKHGKLPKPVPPAPVNARGVALVLSVDRDLANPELKYYGVGDNEWWYSMKGVTVVRGISCS